MGTKSNKNISGVIGAIGAVGGLITAVTPLVEKAIDNAQNKPTEKIDTKVIIPELYRKGFPAAKLHPHRPQFLNAGQSTRHNGP